MSTLPAGTTSLKHHSQRTVRSFTLPYIPPGGNVLLHKHHHEVNRMRRQLHDDVALLARVEPLYEHAVVTLDFRWRTRHRRDIDNAVAGMKAAIDALVGRWIVDDDTEHLELVVKGTTGTGESDRVVVTCESKAGLLARVIGEAKEEEALTHPSARGGEAQPSNLERRADILAIEQEAASQERARLRERAWEMHGHEGGLVVCPECGWIEMLFADPEPAVERAEALESVEGYAAALETIIRSLPGQPIINGVAMSPVDALADLRGRFGLTVDVAADIDRLGAVVRGNGPWPAALRQSVLEAALRSERIAHGCLGSGMPHVEQTTAALRQSGDE